MAVSYHEQLPDDLAKIIMVEAYDPDLRYVLITDSDGTYITAYNKETGEHVSLSQRPDGIPDDYELDVDEFKFIEEEIKLEESKTDYSNRAFRWISVVVVISCVAALASIGFLCISLLK